MLIGPEPAPGLYHLKCHLSLLLGTSPFPGSLHGSATGLALLCQPGPSRLPPDIRDSLMQALASYVCYPHSLRAVERIPEEQ